MLAGPPTRRRSQILDTTGHSQIQVGSRPRLRRPELQSRPPGHQPGLRIAIETPGHELLQRKTPRHLSTISIAAPRIEQLLDLTLALLQRCHPVMGLLSPGPHIREQRFGRPVRYWSCTYVALHRRRRLLPALRVRVPIKAEAQNACVGGSVATEAACSVSPDESASSTTLSPSRAVIITSRAPTASR
jgi:hypothetical protein